MQLSQSSSQLVINMRNVRQGEKNDAKQVQRSSSMALIRPQQTPRSARPKAHSNFAPILPLRHSNSTRELRSATLCDLDIASAGLLHREPSFRDRVAKSLGLPSNEPKKQKKKKAKKMRALDLKNIDDVEARERKRRKKKKAVCFDKSSDPRVKEFEGRDVLGINIAMEKKVIIGCSMVKLIQRLTSPKLVHAGFMKAFLLSYRLFITPNELLELLHLRWNCYPPVNISLPKWKKKGLFNIRLRITRVIKHWLQNYFEDFLETKGLIQKLEKFCAYCKASGFGVSATFLELALDAKKNKTVSLRANEKAPVPEFWADDKNKSEYDSIRELHPNEVSRQITLMDNQLYMHLRPRELLVSDDKEANKDNNSSVEKWRAFSDHLRNWTITQIVKERDLQPRIVVLKQLILVCEGCYKLGNFNAAIEIYKALRSNTVEDLQGTWRSLPFDVMQRFTGLDGLFKDKGMSYPTQLQNSKKLGLAVTPHLETLCDDLKELSITTPNLISGTDMVNFEKLEQNSELILAFLSFRNSAANVEKVPSIVSFIKQEPLTPGRQVKLARKCKE